MGIHRCKQAIRFGTRGVVVGALVALGLTVTASMASAGWGTAINPPANVVPSASYAGPCADWQSTAPTAACPSDLGYIDALRAADGGVVPMTLPSDYSSLTPSEQLFVVANLERVDRGLAPIAGVASSLDALAQVGADHSVDPTFPPYGDGGGSNWAGGNDILGAYGLWMYEDGLGGGNEDCTSATDAGCWGHRDNILNTYATPLLMGGAVSTSGEFGGSSAEIFIGGDTTDTPYFSWSTATSDLPVGTWPTSFTNDVSPGGSASDPLELWASGEAMNVGLAVSGGAGAGAFSVSAKGCNLSVGQSCNVSVTFAPKAVGTYSASLDVTGPNGVQVLPLHGTAGPGYRVVASDGGIFSFGNAQFYGSTGGLRLNRPIVGMASTPDGRGYWLVASDGGIFAYGDASFYGSTGGTVLNKPIVGMAATPDGRGYWLVASDGGIFAYGDAQFYGSTGGTVLNQPIVGIASTPDGGGYYLVASDGGIFAFGDAAFQGSTGSIRLNKPIVGMALDQATGGYWLVASDGGIFSFNAPFDGSVGSALGNQTVVGMAASPDGGGYWLVAANGQVFNYGDAAYFGSVDSSSLNAPVVGVSVS